MKISPVFLWNFFKVYIMLTELILKIVSYEDKAFHHRIFGMYVICAKCTDQNKTHRHRLQSK